MRAWINRALLAARLLQPPPPEETDECPRCHGQGSLPALRGPGRGTSTTRYACIECGGSGYVTRR